MSNLSKTRLGPDHQYPSQARLKELLIYEPETGLLFWRTKRRGVSTAYSRAGCSTGDGYIKVSINGTQYKAHQIIWRYVTGTWPDHWIDHRDTDGTNNRWGNLRRASVETNNQNSKSKKRAGGLSALKGAYFSKQKQRWHSRIMSNKKLIVLGFFDTPEEAHAAYCSAARDLHGEFARET